jgi:hypothetical protein
VKGWEERTKGKGIKGKDGKRTKEKGRKGTKAKGRRRKDIGKMFQRSKSE